MTIMRGCLPRVHGLSLANISRFNRGLQSLILSKHFLAAPWFGSDYRGLLGFLYKRQILEEIGGLIGTVTKLDFQTDKGSRGNFARMVVCIDLIKPLVSQILVNRAVQKVEFEALLFVCFSCGRFGHSNATCVEMGYSQNAGDGMNTAMESLLEVVKAVEPLEPFGPWMIVERKSRHNSSARINTETKIAMNNALNLFGIWKG
ncbi:hypothetical protein PVK06_048461 [Gossypium arboreum]|uniref:CCHC-type domain-containing protein n=1 Tax=Gossypium arboreum TaxID=29729 RepID=A0ABR0MGI1_GOSAR|nr:hypothetical protein PVK06_048461 [Gossypium arboreum]